MDLITNEINSASFGGTLLAHLTASFEQNILQKTLPVAKGDGPHLAQGPENRLLYYAAHDINLLYVRNLLRCVWKVFFVIAIASTPFICKHFCHVNAFCSIDCSGIRKAGTHISQCQEAC